MRDVSRAAEMKPRAAKHVTSAMSVIATMAVSSLEPVQTTAEQDAQKDRAQATGLKKKPLAKKAKQLNAATIPTPASMANGFSPNESHQKSLLNRGTVLSNVSMLRDGA